MQKEIYFLQVQPTIFSKCHKKIQEKRLQQYQDSLKIQKPICKVTFLDKSNTAHYP